MVRLVADSCLEWVLIAIGTAMMAWATVDAIAWFLDLW